MKNTIKLLGAIIIIMMFPSILRAQAINFSISGKVSKLSPAYKAYLVYQHLDGFKVDSTVINQGNFTFNGAAKGPTITYLCIGKGFGDKNKKVKTFYLEQGQITVVSMDSLENAVVTGGKVNADYTMLQKALEPFEHKKDSLSKEYYAAPAEKRKSEEYKAYVNKMGDSLNKEERPIEKNFILNNPNSFISFLTLKDIGGSTPDVAEVKPLFNSLSAEMRLSPQGVEYGAMLKNLEKTIIGALAPDFTEADTSGKPISLHDFKGKYVLVDFWASWCGPCRAENPNVVKAYNKYKDNGFTVLGVSLDDRKSKDKWVKAINDDHLIWTEVSDLKGWKNEAALLYSVGAIPQNFLVDPDGKIVAKDLRGDDLEKALSGIFK